MVLYISSYTKQLNGDIGDDNEKIMMATLETSNFMS